MGPSRAIHNHPTGGKMIELLGLVMHLRRVVIYQEANQREHEPERRKAMACGVRPAKTLWLATLIFGALSRETCFLGRLGVSHYFVFDFGLARIGACFHGGASQFFRRSWGSLYGKIFASHVLRCCCRCDCRCGYIVDCHIPVACQDRRSRESIA